MKTEYNTKLDSECDILDTALMMCYTMIESLPNNAWGLGMHQSIFFQAAVVDNLASINKFVDILTVDLPVGVPNHKKAGFVSYVLATEYLNKCEDGFSLKYTSSQFVRDAYVKWQNSVHASVESILAHNF